MRLVALIIVALAIGGCGGPSTYDRAVTACGGPKKIAQLSADGFRCKPKARSHYFGSDNR